jgi:hypothetical protein
VVSVLVIGLKFRVNKPDRGQWNLKGDNIRSTTSFGGEIKLSAYCVKFYGMLKIPTGIKLMLLGKSHIHFSPRLFCFAARCLCWLLLEISGG